MNRIILIFILYSFVSCYNTPKELEGVYVNNYNSDVGVHSPEAPSRIDTLILYENGTFSSKWFGQGTFTTTCSTLDLHFKEGNSRVGFNFLLKKVNLFRKTNRLYMDLDLDYFYEKIN